MGQEGNHLTRERLKQYEDLAAELKEAETRLHRQTQHAEQDLAVNGYSLFGDIFDVERHVLEVEQMRERVRCERVAIERYIDSIAESIARRAMRLRYLDGMSWADVEIRMRYAGESGSRVLCERVMQKQDG